jgi:hypothetical protein
MQKSKYRRTLTIASLAARRLVGKKSDAFVAERLGQLRGLPQKVGQILALNDLEEGERTTAHSPRARANWPLPKCAR